MQGKLIHAAPGLKVHDLNAAKRYYVEVLGFTAGYSNEGYATLERDSVPGHLELDTSGNGAGRGFCYMRIENVDLLYQEFVANGAHVDRPIEDSPYGMRDFNIADPDGNVLGFGAPLDT